MPVASRLPRRDFLLTSAAGSIACVLGCDAKQQAAPAPAVQRSDVPLRVLLCGTDAWAEAISTAWSGITEQPLAIEVLDMPGGTNDSNRADAVGQERDFGQHVVEKMLACDVAIVPCGLMPTLSAEGSFVTLGPQLADDDQLGAERMLSALRQSPMRWAGEPVAIPLGSVQPALLISGETAADSLELPRTWQAFVELAAQLQSSAASDEPVVCEPLAGGAAAKMFLWRAADAAPAAWLFNRESFEPVLRDAVYVQTLQRMRQCAELYGGRRLTAGEVWNALASGSLKMAIGWPGASGDPPRVSALGDSLVTALPREADAQTARGATAAQSAGVMIDPESPVGLISSRCRQSAVAKRFLVWLSGGDGSEMIRHAAPEMTVLHHDPLAPPEATAGAASYDEYLISRLSSLHLRPTLRLHGYDRYLAALDQQVLRCLDGAASPAEALQGAEHAWRAITAEVGADIQARAWRQAQGLRN